MAWTGKAKSNVYAVSDPKLVAAAEAGVPLVEFLRQQAQIDTWSRFQSLAMLLGVNVGDPPPHWDLYDFEVVADVAEKLVGAASAAYVLSQAKE
jgi:hypothetical protein